MDKEQEVEEVGVPGESLEDIRYMQRALRLAAETVGLASPNPQVGCVLTRDGVTIGEGAHLYDERSHAEISALKQAAALGNPTYGATAYVTLEPCAHHGRTGPCVDALLAAGITRVVIATNDPNPAVSGRSIQKLRTAGIEVIVGLLQQSARNLNDSFAHFIKNGSPFVTLKAALSIDGKLAPSPNLRFDNNPYWLTGPAALADVQRLRHESDAILTGIGTILTDDPLLTDRTNLRRRRPLLRVILDSRLRTPPSSQIIRTADNDVLIFCNASIPAGKIDELEQAGAEVLPIGSGDGLVPLADVLSSLAKRQVQSVLLEGGSSLNGSFLAQNLVHKVLLFYSEIALGPSAVPFATGISSPYSLKQTLKRTECITFPNGRHKDTRFSGYIHDPWVSLSE